MPKNNKLTNTLLALLLAVATVIGVFGTNIDTDPDSSDACPDSYVVYDAEAECPDEAMALANNSNDVDYDSLSPAEKIKWLREHGGQTGNKSTYDASKYEYTYADGTKSHYYLELVKADTGKKWSETLVKSGVTNKITGTTKKTNSYGTIDWTHANEGWVTLTLTKSTSKKIKGAVDYTDKDGNVKYCDWYMEKGKSYDIPMYYGDGKYAVTLYEHIKDNRYNAKLTKNLNVKLNSEFAPFLHSTKDANFDAAPNAVAKAKELTANCKTDREKINVIYNWVYDNIKYDAVWANENDKYTQDQIDYDLDKTLETRKGVCGDRTALMAGMLRSLGIPCKVVHGDAHAWIEIWNETGTETKKGVTYSTGAWVTLDSTAKSTAGQTEDKIKYYG